MITINTPNYRKGTNSFIYFFSSGFGFHIINNNTASNNHKDGMLMLLTREHNYADASIVCRSPTLFSGNSASANPPTGKDHLAVA
jgi:hypothetical protein